MASLLGIDEERLKQLAKEKNINYDDAAKHIQRYRQLNEKSIERRTAISNGQGGASITEETKSALEGVIITATIMGVAKKPITGKATGEKYEKAEYKLLISEDFSDASVPSKRGTKLSDHEIELNIEIAKEMTPEEKAAWMKKKEENGESVRGNTKYARFNEGTMTIRYKELIIAEHFGDTFPLGHDEKKFTVGDVVNVGLEASLLRKIGSTWNTPAIKITGMEKCSDTKSTDVSIYRELAFRTRIPVLSDQFGYGDHNITGADVEKDRELESEGKKRSEFSQIVSRMTYEDRPLANDVFLVNLSPNMENHMLPLWAMGQDKVHKFTPPIWQKLAKEAYKDFTTKEDMTRKVASIKYDVLVMEQSDDRTKNALLEVKIPEKILEQYGISNPSRFEKIAPFYVPFCEGFLGAKISLAKSVTLQENIKKMNPVLNTDTLETSRGYHYATINNALFAIELGLAGGIIDCGYEIIPEHAIEIMKQQFGKESLTAVEGGQKKTIAEDIKKNHLNTVADSKVYNLFETSHTVTQLAEKGYRFYFVGGIEKKRDVNFKRFNNKIEKKKLDPIVTNGEIILRKNGRDDEFSGYPAKINAEKDNFCLFAVDGKAVIAHEKEIERQLSEQKKNDLIEDMDNDELFEILSNIEENYTAQKRKAEIKKEEEEEEKSKAKKQKQSHVPVKKIDKTESISGDEGEGEEELPEQNGEDILEEEFDDGF